MAGWADSGASRGRGGGAFTNRGGANTNSGVRWRERRPPGPPPHQQQRQQEPQQRFHPVNDNAHHNRRHHHPVQPRSSGPAAAPELPQVQGGSSTSTRRSQPPCPTFTAPKSPASTATPMPLANSNEPEDKARRNAANFECNVCFDMAADPVVTKCGHLFCWECLYQWLHVHSNHRECPVCKGQVADDAIIPIYGRGGSAASVHDAPPRPTGARVESSRQQQVVADWQMDEDDDDPFDLEEMRLSSIRNAMMSIMPSDEQLFDYDDYTNPYNNDDFDEVYDYDLLGFPVFASAGAGAGAGAGSSRGHGYRSVVSDDFMETFFDSTFGTHQTVDFSYRGGRRQRGRARGAGGSSADHSNIVGMVMGSSLMMRDSGVNHSDTGAGPRNNTGGSSRPNGGLGWTERRGRSNRNSNPGGGRGMQNSRRHGANYN